jgi:hypothetical protein
MLDTGDLPLGQYTVTHAHADDANFDAAPPASSTLTVTNAGSPHVTVNPTSQDVSPGDAVGFAAQATSISAQTIYWQVSTDGEATWSNVTSNTSATTTTLVVQATLAMNGNQYRSVFTNSAGTAVSATATLIVTLDGGGNRDETTTGWGNPRPLVRYPDVDD